MTSKTSVFNFYNSTQYNKHIIAGLFFCIHVHFCSNYLVKANEHSLALNFQDKFCKGGLTEGQGFVSKCDANNNELGDPPRPSVKAS